MENKISTPRGITQQPTKEQSTFLRIGAVVEARVLNQSGHSLRLQIGHNIVTAQLAGHRGEIPKTGRFEVVRTEPTPVLKLYKPAPESVNTAAQKLARHTLPTQRPLTHLLDKMNTVTQADFASISPADRRQKPSNNLQYLVANAMQGVANKLPELGVVASVAGLRQAIKTSGGFLENHLSALHPSEIAKDFKASLLQARETLRGALYLPSLEQSSARKRNGELRSQPGVSAIGLVSKNLSVDSMIKVLETGISRIETLQLANHLLAASGQNLIHLEVPLRVGSQIECIQLVIEQEAQTASTQAELVESSTIYLALSIREDQELRAKVCFLSGDISVTLWSDNEQLQHQLRSHLHQLSDSLSSNLAKKPSLAVRAFVNRFIDPSKTFSGLVSDSA